MAADHDRDAAIAALRQFASGLARIAALAVVSATPTRPPSREQVAREAWEFDQLLAKRDAELAEMESAATAEALALGERLRAERDPAAVHDLAGQVCRKVDLVQECRKLRVDLAAMRISREEVAQAMERRCKPATTTDDDAKAWRRIQAYRLRQLPEYCEPCASTKRPFMQRRLIQAVVITLVKNGGMEPVALCTDCAKRWAPEALRAVTEPPGGQHG
jgi:hypothetical protein